METGLRCPHRPGFMAPELPGSIWLVTEFCLKIDSTGEESMDRSYAIFNQMDQRVISGDRQEGPKLRS